MGADVRLEDFKEEFFEAPAFTDEYGPNLTEEERAGLVAGLRAVKNRGAAVFPKSWTAEVVWISGLAEWVETWNTELGTIWAD